MKNEQYLQDKVGKDPGFGVPAGYFEGLDIKVMQALPPYPEQPAERRLTAWERVKPYVYMAAMFAGIWLTMKVFHDVSSSASRLSLDNPPEAIAMAMASYEGPETAPYISDSQNYYDFELIQDVSASYPDMEAFEEDFGYELKPEYGG